MTWLLAAVSLRRSCCYLSATYNGAQCVTMEAGTKIHIPANKASVNRAVDLGKLLLELSTKFRDSFHNIRRMPLLTSGAGVHDEE